MDITVWNAENISIKKIVLTSNTAKLNDQTERISCLYSIYLFKILKLCVALSSYGALHQMLACTSQRPILRLLVNFSAFNYHRTAQLSSSWGFQGTFLRAVARAAATTNAVLQRRKKTSALRHLFQPTRHWDISSQMLRMYSITYCNECSKSLYLCFPVRCSL
jgi:hypothetical protein